VGEGYPHIIPSARHNASAPLNLERIPARQHTRECSRVAIVNRHANLYSIIKTLSAPVRTANGSHAACRG
jgi:hypothetical protein